MHFQNSRSRLDDVDKVTVPGRVHYPDAALDDVRNVQYQVALVLLELERNPDEHDSVPLAGDAEIDLVQREAMLLLVRFAIEQVHGLVC